ncbi:unnamed protein product [Taenia asiatica]|uniref:Centrosomal protein of 44 kDa n=1 Tax=Taenia asiatica TaxID=60517 RepID=A0A0R3W6X3_TAEAS|nr:unnamed protein product [Taenia asiatica]
MAEEFLPQSLCILSLAENDIPTLTEFKSLIHCRSLLQLSIQGNLCAFNQYPFACLSQVLVNLVAFRTSLFTTLAIGSEDVNIFFTVERHTGLYLYLLLYLGTRIPHSRSYILALLPTLNFIDGNQPLQDERLLGEWIAGSGAVHRFESEGESALIDFLRSLNPDLPHYVEPRFRRQSDTTRRVACSRAPVLKRGFTAANDATPPISRRSTPPRWLQRARSAQNITSTAAVAASTCLADLANSYGNLEPSLRCQPQISIASCNAILAPTNPCVPHLLRSDSIFIPIDSEAELEEAEAEARVQSPKNVSQTVSVDLPSDWHPHSASEPTRKPSSVPDIENDRDGDISLVHRLQFSRGALASLLQHRSCINEGPAINMMSEKAERRSNEEASEACSPLSEHTFVVGKCSPEGDYFLLRFDLFPSFQIDPPFEPARSPEGLEAKVLALRRQLEELRVLSVNQERERLRQASDIRHLAEEVRSLKAWKASVLQRQDVNHPAAGDCKHHKFHSVTDPKSAPQGVWSVHMSAVSPSLSTLVAINTSSPTDVTANIGASTVCDVERVEDEEDEEDEESHIDDSDSGGDGVGDFPDPRASSSDMNGTLLTANISTDSLDTRRSRLSTSMGFVTSSTRLRNAEVNTCSCVKSYY